MTEPVVGMRFGTYNTLREQNDKYYKDTTETSKSLTNWYGKQVGTHILNSWSIPTDSKNVYKRIGGHKRLANSDSSYNYGKLKVIHKTEKGRFSTLYYSGTERTENNDIIFNYIYGECEGAYDSNHNGIVDKGEIFYLD